MEWQTSRRRAWPCIPMPKGRGFTATFGKYKDVSEFDIHYVGFEFMKKRMYFKDSAIRKGHFRWQRCGTGRTEVDLIWIDETTVHYKNVHPLN